MEINVLENDEQLRTSMYNQISNVIAENKTKMIYQINNTLIETNFMIGKIIVENEQKNMYVNYYNKEIKDEFDNETIGIILCTGKKV